MELGLLEKDNDGIKLAYYKNQKETIVAPVKWARVRQHERRMQLSMGMTMSGLVTVKSLIFILPAMERQIDFKK